MSREHDIYLREAELAASLLRDMFEVENKFAKSNDYADLVQLAKTMDYVAIYSFRFDDSVRDHVRIRVAELANKYHSNLVEVSSRLPNVKQTTDYVKNKLKLTF